MAPPGRQRQTGGESAAGPEKDASRDHGAGYFKSAAALAAEMYQRMTW